MNRYSFLSFRLPSAIALASLSLLTLAGCGGGDDDPNAGLPIVVASPGTSPFAGRSTGTVVLSEGRTGSLDFAVDSANRITGTLTVTGGSRAYSFSLGTFNMTGAVDPATGAFTLTGNIPGSGPFTITGTLPSAGNGGGYTLTAGGETYTGGFGPLPSPSASPLPNASPSPAPLAGGAATATFTDITGTDAVLDAYTATEVEAKKNDNFLYDSFSVESGEERRYSVGNASVLATRTFNVTVLTEKGGTGPARVVNPQATPDTTKPPVPVVTIFFYSYVTGGSLSDARTYVAEGGDVEILSNNGSEVRVRVTNAHMVPLKPFSSALPQATGSFTLNGELTSTVK